MTSSFFQLEPQTDQLTHLLVLRIIAIMKGKVSAQCPKHCDFRCQPGARWSGNFSTPKFQCCSCSNLRSWQSFLMVALLPGRVDPRATSGVRSSQISTLIKLLEAEGTCTMELMVGGLVPSANSLLHRQNRWPIGSR